MNTLIFGLLWTVLAAAMAVGLLSRPEVYHEPIFFKIVMALMPFAGVLPIRDGLQRVRRYRSVRREDGPSGPIFTWTDFDGSLKRDTMDPRPAWDAEDRNFAD